MNALFEPKPRWPGAPLICVAENLPAFASRAELDEFHRRYSPSVHVHHVGKCAVCDCWHARGVLGPTQRRHG